MARHTKPILVLMGPTASGKSAIGAYLAQKLGGVIINADAMQCYGDLQIITARPTEAEMGSVAHHLYGIWPATTHGNAVLWQQVAIPQIEKAHAAGKIPILLGGTGLYIKGLMDGMSHVPPICDAVKEWVLQLAYEGEALLYPILQEKDPKMAKQLQPGDSQRILRALEVMEQTGKSLADWQQERMSAPYEPSQFHYFYVDIPRDVVYARINHRFSEMVQAGAIEEVQALKACFSEEEMLHWEQLGYPLLKAHGVPELLAYLDGELKLDEAIARAQRNTRRYAKRQMTWIRGQVSAAHPIPYDTFKAYISVMGGSASLGIGTAQVSDI